MRGGGGGGGGGAAGGGGGATGGGAGGGGGGGGGGTSTASVRSFGSGPTGPRNSGSGAAAGASAGLRGRRERHRTGARRGRRRRGRRSLLLLHIDRLIEDSRLRKAGAATRAAAARTKGVLRSDLVISGSAARFYRACCCILSCARSARVNGLRPTGRRVRRATGRAILVHRSADASDRRAFQSGARAHGLHPPHHLGEILLASCGWRPAPTPHLPNHRTRWRRLSRACADRHRPIRASAFPALHPAGRSNSFTVPSSSRSSAMRSSRRCCAAASN